MATISNISSPRISIAVTKQQLDAIMTGITFHSTKPANPQHGDVYVDSNTYYSYVWIGNTWTLFSENEANKPAFTPPTQEQLEKHPALKAAWNEFLVLKRLLGV